ncbi:MAG TPA: hypothetical protein VE860_03685 [Chthoniobacterales bacterium]|nr:hypothetical protein [Chthoniobacterales bacterium]
MAITGRNPQTLRQAAKKLGNSVLALQADVTDIEATERVVDTLIKQWGPPLQPRAPYAQACELLGLSMLRREREERAMPWSLNQRMRLQPL